MSNGRLLPSYLIIVCLGSGLKGGLDRLLEAAVQLLQTCDSRPSPRLHIQAQDSFSSLGPEVVAQRLQHL